MHCFQTDYENVKMWKSNKMKRGFYTNRSEYNKGVTKIKLESSRKRLQKGSEDESDVVENSITLSKVAYKEKHSTKGPSQQSGHTRVGTPKISFEDVKPVMVQLPIQLNRSPYLRYVDRERMPEIGFKMPPSLSDTFPRTKKKSHFLNQDHYQRWIKNAQYYFPVEFKESSVPQHPKVKCKGSKSQNSKAKRVGSAPQSPSAKLQRINSAPQSQSSKGNTYTVSENSTGKSLNFLKDVMEYQTSERSSNKSKIKKKRPKSNVARKTAEATKGKEMSANQQVKEPNSISDGRISPIRKGSALSERQMKRIGSAASSVRFAEDTKSGFYDDTKSIADSDIVSVSTLTSLGISNLYHKYESSDNEDETISVNRNETFSPEVHPSDSASQVGMPTGRFLDDMTQTSELSFKEREKIRQNNKKMLSQRIEFNEEVKRLHKELLEFKLQCQKEASEYSSRIQRERQRVKQYKEKAKEHTKHVNFSELDELQFEKLQLETLQDENALLKRNQDLIDMEQNLLLKEEEIGKKNQEIKEFEEEINELESVLNRRLLMTKKKEMEVLALDEEMNRLREVMRNKKQNVEENCQSEEVEMEQKTAAVRWKMIRENLLNKTFSMERKMKEYKAGMVEADKTVNGLNGKVDELVERLKKREQKIKDLKTQLELTVQQVIANNKDSINSPPAPITRQRSNQGSNILRSDKGSRITPFSRRLLRSSLPVERIDVESKIPPEFQKNSEINRVPPGFMKSDNLKNEMRQRKVSDRLNSGACVIS